MFDAKTDAQLCGLSAGGSADAFTELVRRTQGAVCAVTYAATGRRDISEDLAQETYLLAWRKLRQRALEEPEKVAGWLCGIGRNLARKTRRERKPVRLDDVEELVEEQETIEDAAADRQRRDQMWALLAELPLRYREVMVLYYRQEQSTPRVSELLGISVSAAEQRLSRGRKMLRAKVERALGDELARTRPTEAFAARVAAALPVGVIAPGAGAATTRALRPLTRTLSMKTLALTTAALATTVTVGYVALRGDDEPEPDSVIDAEPTTARADPLRVETATTGQRVLGSVLDADTGRPIEGAVVTLTRRGHGVVMMPTASGSLEPVVVRSDAEGSWTVRDLPPGRYTAVASAGGRLPGVVPTFTVVEGQDVQGLAFELSAGGLQLEGVVSDIGGGPVAGATVRAKGADGLPVTAVSDDEGRYQLDLPPGRYEVSIWDANYQDRLERVSLEGAGARLDFELLPAATIAGRVVERGTGVPVVDAVVSFRRTVRYDGSFSTERADLDDTAVTDRQGRFVLRRLSPAEYALDASADHLATRAPAQVVLGIADQVEGVVLQADPAFNATGTVFAEGRPSAGLEGLSITTLSRDAQLTTTSGPDGRFELRGLRPGTHPLLVVGSSVIPSLMQVSVTIADEDATGLEVPIESGVEVSGRVDPPGVANVELALLESVGGMEVMLNGQKIQHAKATAAPDGTFTIPAAPRGTWKVVAEAVDGSIGETEIEVEGDAIDGLRVAMVSRPAARGRVVDADGAPVERATVILMADDPRAVGRVKMLLERSAKSTTTDAQGRFSVVGLQSGSYRLRAKDPRGIVLPRLGRDDDRGEPIEIAGDDADASVEGVELRVERPSRTLTGRVVDEDGQPQADAWVRLMKSGDGMGFLDPVVAVTDAEGTFAFDSLARGSYDVDARSNHGDALGGQDDVAASGTIEIVLEPLGTVRGRVSFDGQPFTSFTVSGGATPRTFLDPDGRFELPRMPVGHPLLTVAAANGGLGKRVEVVGGEVTEVDFELGAWATIEGRAVDEAGNPLAGLTVRAASDGGVRDDRRRYEAETTGKAVVTDSEGRFTFDGVGPGRGQLTFAESVGGSGSMFATSVVRGGVTFYVDAASVTDVGDAVLLPSETVERKAQGSLAMRVRALYDRSRVVGDDEYVPPTGPPSGPAKLFVTSIEDDGPAARAGVKPGEAIETIDGAQVSELGPATAARLLVSERIEKGQEVRLGLAKAGGGVREVVLRAR